MTRYFTALITFMFALVIAGLMFDGFDSQQGIAVTVILSLAAAVAVYMLAPKNNKDDEWAGKRTRANLINHLTQPHPASRTSPSQNSLGTAHHGRDPLCPPLRLRLSALTSKADSALNATGYSRSS